MNLKILDICVIDKRSIALIHSHSNKDMVNAIRELQQVQKDFNKLKEIFECEIERCVHCGNYKRKGFGCDCSSEI